MIEATQQIRIVCDGGCLRAVKKYAEGKPLSRSEIEEYATSIGFCVYFHRPTGRTHVYCESCAKDLEKHKENGFYKDLKKK